MESRRGACSSEEVFGVLSTVLELMCEVWVHVGPCGGDTCPPKPLVGGSNSPNSMPSAWVPSSGKLNHRNPGPPSKGLDRRIRRPEFSTRGSLVVSKGLPFDKNLLCVKTSMEGYETARTHGMKPLRAFVIHPGITPLANGPEWFKITRLCPEMCLNGVNTQWVYSQGVLQKPIENQGKPQRLCYLQGDHISETKVSEHCEMDFVRPKGPIPSRPPARWSPSFLWVCTTPRGTQLG